MLEYRALKFLRELEEGNPELMLDALIFNYLLNQHLLPVYKPTKETQSCLFIGVGKDEVIATRHFLATNYRYANGSVFVAGLKLGPDVYSEQVCDFFIGDELLGDARSSGTYLDIRHKTGRAEFDLIVVRRPSTYTAFSGNSLEAIFEQGMRHLKTDGRLVATSGFNDEDGKFKEILESSALVPLVNQHTKLKELGLNTEGYIFIGGKPV
ncbi:hypothetical protein HYU12_03070 [Candidatus Woesearchaeota archaeon]|nr:hypothetical protein [Candidatus Woesearchaeota archaeon]